MPPKKRKAAAASAAAASSAPAKKAKAAGVGGAFKVDEHAPPGTKVHQDYSAMLNQVNLAQNNNKFYVLQLLESGGQLLLFTRYGRVGEVGKPETKTNATAKDFEKKYRSKTKNAWKGASDPDFVKKPGSYDLMEMDLDDDLPEGLDEPAAGGAAAAAVAACTLEPRVKEFVKLIFDHDMFKSQMESTFKLDTSKLPLGKLSKAQLDKGMAVLSEIEDALPRGNRATLIELTSRFYTVIPHASNRATILPVIDTAEGLQTKRDMVSALGDIEAALAMQKNADATGDVEAHPLDKAYSSMATDLQAVTKSSKEFKLIKTFAENTKTPENFGGWMTGSTVRREILEVFKVDRKEEGARFAKHSKLGNRKLLWHGTNVAVVAAIMKSGLRIMPHSGGRVGKGIYLASENSKSAGYVRSDYKSKTGIMFLCEGAMGKEAKIFRDDSSLVKPPKGFDSVLAVGASEPDPSKDATMKIDGKNVVIPQGKPIRNSLVEDETTFSQSEYLLYQESQVRIRYAITFRWG